MRARAALIFGIGLALASTQSGAETANQGSSTTGSPDAAVAAIIAAGTRNTSGLTTYVVDSIDQEYAILAVLGLQPHLQSLVLGEDGTAYDVFETSGGPIRFDISSFFGQGF